jgi:exopolyphosphatase/guanosine-5'-triphosphate,3'-diphosphate pyrophosphatase
MTTRYHRLAPFSLMLALAACGYSQEEWDQKVRENESLRGQLSEQRQANKKCESDYAAALQEIDDLKRQLTERGINLENLNASLAEQRRALEEYARRTEQLDQIRKRFEALQSKLQTLTQFGLKVEVRNNRILIQLPGDVLFDSGSDKLKKDGSDILRRHFQGQLGPVGDARALRAGAPDRPSGQGRRRAQAEQLERRGLLRHRSGFDQRNGRGTQEKPPSRARGSARRRRNAEPEEPGAVSGPHADPPQKTRAIRVGAIDIGTNTVLLLIAERRAARIVALCERSTITRLGEGVDRTRELGSEARQRTLACITDYARSLGELGVTRLSCVGTSAMRDARGADAFADDVATILGTRPHILSGDEEAELTFRGSLSGLELAGAVGVFDIGGGSTEIIQGEASAEPRLTAARSLNVGSVRLFERHVSSDPPRSAELARVRAEISRALDHAPAFRVGSTLVGVAGTVTTIAAIALELGSYDSARVHGLKLFASEISRVARVLETLTIAQRLKLSGLEPRRADVIVVGANILEGIVERAGASAIVVSDRGVRWGLAEASLAEPEPSV